jgi:transcriptional regulator with XRE-family HTH domain
MKLNKELILVGNKIRYLRKKAGFSQEAFALKIEMGRAFYGRVERGEQNISILNLIKIAFGLNIDPGDLLPTLKELPAVSAPLKK